MGNPKSAGSSKGEKVAICEEWKRCSHRSYILTAGFIIVAPFKGTGGVKS